MFEGDRSLSNKGIPDTDSAFCQETVRSMFILKACNYVNQSKWPMSFYIIETSKTEAIQMDRVSHPYNVPKCVLGRSSYLHTDMTAHGSYSDPDGGGKNISVGDNVYLK